MYISEVKISVLLRDKWRLNAKVGQKVTHNLLYLDNGKHKRNEVLLVEAMILWFFGNVTRYMMHLLHCFVAIVISMIRMPVRKTLEVVNYYIFFSHALRNLKTVFLTQKTWVIQTQRNPMTLDQNCLRVVRTTAHPSWSIFWCIMCATCGFVLSWWNLMSFTTNFGFIARKIRWSLSNG